MDYNDLPMQGIMGMGGLPLGFAQALAMDEDLLAGYHDMTESEREKLIFKYQDAKSKEEKQNILNLLLPGESTAYEKYIDDLPQGPSIG